MSLLVSVSEFREWAGANVPATVPDHLVQKCLDEAEAGLQAEVGASITAIAANDLAEDEGIGEILRRAGRLLARRNSPEGVLGAGLDGFVTIPVRDADSQRAVWHIKAHMGVAEGIA